MENESLTKPENPPSPQELEAFIGEEHFKYWEQLTGWISRSYPGVFIPEWIRTGKKGGWYLRYKKSKSFCQFIPKKNQFVVLITFGAKERIKVEAIRSELSPEMQKAYDAATTYHDGKWLYMVVSEAHMIPDLQTLLSIKRKTKLK